MINNLFHNIQTKLSLIFFISLLTAFANAGTLSGTVTDSAGGAPIEDIDVTTMIWDPILELFQTVDWGFTDANGYYKIIDLPEDTYYVMFSDYINNVYIEEGYDDVTPFNFGAIGAKTSVFVAAAGTTPDIDAQLELGGQIAGHVSDVDSSNPIKNIHVSAWTWDGADFHYIYGWDTDDLGDYTLGGLPADTYYVMFSAYTNQLYTEEGYDGEVPFNFDGIGNKTPVTVTVGTTDTVDAQLKMLDTACSSNKVFISDTQYSADFTLQSEQKIITSETVTIKNGVTVSYQAPVVTLKPGFHAEAGSQFSATAMSISCPTALQGRSSAQSLTFTVAAEEPLTDIQAIQTPGYLISQWLTAADIPESLQRLLEDKDAAAKEIQSNASGEIIVFSTQTALLDNDTNDVSDIYIYHSLSDSLSLISHTIDNISGNGSSTQARINGSGKYIIYRSEADNLNSTRTENHIDDNNVADIYLYDIAAKQTIRVSREEDGSQTRHHAYNPSIAGDAPYMVYDKSDTLQQQHVYGVNITTDNTSAIKYSDDYNSFGEIIDNSQSGISADGRYVAYLGQSNNEDKTCSQHILDRETETSQVSSCPDEIADNPQQWFPLFGSQAENVYWQQIK